MFNFRIFKIFFFILLLIRLASLILLIYSLVLRQTFLIDWELFSFNGTVFRYNLLLDWISLSFLFIVFLISRIVIYYRHSYISHETTKNSFSYVVFLFVLSIIFLIISPSLVRVILGWDGLGLVSYLLVIYYQNYKSYSAGLLTCLTNRIGDSAILISIAWLLRVGSVDFIYYYLTDTKELVIASAFVIAAAITKRAQIPFSAWLPAAIAAPTPVSALVHSSTLVTAGVYLLLRFFPLFNFSFIKILLLFRATLTIIISSLGALFETDLKKVIALSTLSQLGLIIMALSIELYLLAFFHLLTHALFKASLFLCAGRIIHLYGGSQDVRNLSAVARFIPLTSACFRVCSLSLGGFPFLAAFYSKDKIIEEAFSGAYNPLLLRLLFISIILTTIYRFRLIYFIRIRSYEVNYNCIKDDFTIVKSMIVLTFGGVTGGAAFSWIIFDSCYDNLFRGLKLLVIFFLRLGLRIRVMFAKEKLSLSIFYLRQMWFLPDLRTKFSSLLGLFYSSFSYKYWDCGWNEIIGAKGVRAEMRILSNRLDLFNHLNFKKVLFVRFINLVIFVLLFYCCSL